MNVTIVLKINKKYNGTYTKKGNYLNLDYSYRQSDPFSKKDFSYWMEEVLSLAKKNRSKQRGGYLCSILKLRWWND
jgi:hypothetical protein